MKIFSIFFQKRNNIISLRKLWHKGLSLFSNLGCIKLKILIKANLVFAEIFSQAVQRYVQIGLPFFTIFSIGAILEYSSAWFISLPLFLAVGLTAYYTMQ